MSGGASCWEKTQTAVSPFLEYDTVKTVHIRSKKVGLLFRLIQLGILGYIIGYVIVYKKGYQEIDQAVSSVVTKVKGTAASCDLNMSLANCPNASVRIWDTVDYTIPAQENNAFFIVTNFVETPRQYQREEGWDEDPKANTTGSNKVYYCDTDADCPRYAASRNGVLSGVCNQSTHRCRILGWGPIELIDTDNAAESPNSNTLLPAAENFTVFIKNNIFFPKFNTKFANTGIVKRPPSYFTSCTWSRDRDPYCPVFRIGDILVEAGITNFRKNEVATGAVISIGMQYNCNLDTDTTCAPSLTFTRTDDPNDPLSAGYNFRQAYYTSSYATGFVHRDLYKVFGLRFIFVVSGTAGRFSFIPLLVAFGSGLGLLGLATVLADLLVTKIIQHRAFYMAKKYEVVDESEYQAFYKSIQSNAPTEEGTPLLSTTTR